MIMLGSLIFVTGTVIGIAGANAWFTAIIALMKNEQIREMNVAFEEVKRLRAQVAGLVGRE